ncbi:MAG: hypothetical protein IJW62_04235, partial [Clostridia bacterium]|nr:hypothetical protein [Clostridia bacterium]
MVTAAVMTGSLLFFIFVYLMADSFLPFQILHLNRNTDIIVGLFSTQTNNALDVGQDSKRYIFMSKMGVETPKGIFSDYVITLIISIFPMIWLLKLSSSSAGIH